jgi:hypothetical protein
MSAFPPIATKLRTLREVRFVPKTDMQCMRNGLPIPLPDASGRWRKKKKVVNVSEDIKLAV